MNNDVQAEQIDNAYLDDDEDVATAKASFQAAFDEVVSGGLAAKRAPAPVHLIPEPEGFSAITPFLRAVQTLPGKYPVGPHYGAYPHRGYPYGAYSHGALQYNPLAFSHHSLQYNALSFTL